MVRPEKRWRWNFNIQLTKILKLMSVRAFYINSIRKISPFMSLSGLRTLLIFWKYESKRMCAFEALRQQGAICAVRSQLKEKAKKNHHLWQRRQERKVRWVFKVCSRTRANEAVSKFSTDRCLSVSEHQIPRPLSLAYLHRLDIPPPAKVRELQTVKEASLDRCKSCNVDGSRLFCVPLSVNSPLSVGKLGKFNCEKLFAGKYQDIAPELAAAARNSPTVSLWCVFLSCKFRGRCSWMQPEQPLWLQNAHLLLTEFARKLAWSQIVVPC